jgi:hypothetical protein
MDGCGVIETAVEKVAEVPVGKRHVPDKFATSRVI